MQSARIKDILRNPNITEEGITKMGEDYLTAVDSKNMEDWSWSAYKMSKALINAWARFILPYSISNLEN